MPHPLCLLHQSLGTGGCGYQIQMIAARFHPLLAPMDLKEDEGSCYIAVNRLELRTKRLWIAEDIIQVR